MNQLDLTPLWKALADPKRRRIIRLLHETARTTSEISDCFDVSRFAVMRHLKVLEQAGLIVTKREGRHRWNSLNEALFRQIQQTYLGVDNDAGFQLGEVLGFLTREEGVGAPNLNESEPPSIELEVALPASRERVFQVITEEVDAWWSYRIATDSCMEFEPQIGGRLYERFKSGGGALYGVVTYIKPGQEIRLNGSMALVDSGINNVIYLSLNDDRPDMTHLRLIHRFVGRVNALTFDTFNRSWNEILTQHLKPYIESSMRIHGTTPASTRR